MSEASLHEPFHDLARQREADRFGMLLFLASEVMLFGGLFAGALGLRLAHPMQYAAAAERLHLWFGTANTAVLLTSSLLVALGVEAAKGAKLRHVAWWFTGAAVLGLVFAGIKGTEYWLEYSEGLMPGVNGRAIASGPQRLFMDLYFVSTGLHALHLTIGLFLLAALAVKAWLGRLERVLASNVGLYWHLVDIVWIFLFPTLYLARPA
jgi:cytochrome c oxidase subunit 3